MNAVIIDDEPHCREVLQLLLARHCPDVAITAICDGAAEGLLAIEAMRPQLVFLDVEMPGMNGFELLEQCPRRNFAVIFTTAFDKYAINAIRHSALDFLLKPVDKDELITAVRKASSQAASTGMKVDALLQYLQHQVMPNERLALPSTEGLRILPIKEILYCESDGGYTHIFLQQQEKAAIICRTLKELEELLKDKGFFRVHNSFLVNLAAMQRYIKGDGGEIIMPDGRNIPVARNRKQDFLLRIEKL